MPNIQVKLRRGTEAEHDTTSGGFTGAEGEVTVDTTNDTLRVHDGTTVGGHELRRKDDTIANGEIDNDAVDTDQIAANAVTSAEIAANAVTSAEISDTDTQFLVDDTSAQKKVVVNEGGADVDFRVEGNTDTNLINTDAENDAVGVGIAAESGYALKSSKIKIEGTAAQLWMKDSDQSTGASGYEANVALNTGALRVGFTGETVPSMTLYPEGVLGLPSMSVATANGITTAARGAVNGAIIAVSNGDAGSPCLAVYDEGSSSWLRIALGSAISAT